MFGSRARPQRARAIGRRPGDGFAIHLFANEIARRIAKVEVDAAGEVFANEQAVALASEAHFRTLLFYGQRFSNLDYGNNFCRSVVECGEHR